MAAEKNEHNPGQTQMSFGFCRKTGQTVDKNKSRAFGIAWVVFKKPTLYR